MESLQSSLKEESIQITAENILILKICNCALAVKIL